MVTAIYRLVSLAIFILHAVFVFKVHAEPKAKAMTIAPPEILHCEAYANGKSMGYSSTAIPKISEKMKEGQKSISVYQAFKAACGQALMKCKEKPKEKPTAADKVCMIGLIKYESCKIEFIAGRKTEEFCYDSPLRTFSINPSDVDATISYRIINGSSESHGAAPAIVAPDTDR